MERILMRFQSMYSHHTKTNFIEKKWQALYIYLCIIIVTPVFSGYGINYLIKNKPVDAFLNLSVAIILFAITILFYRTEKRINLYRLGLASLSFLLVYNIGFGSTGESECLWLLIYSPAILYLFGLQEGVRWILIVMTPSILLVFFPDILKTNIYTLEFRIALVIACTLSFLLSLLLEYRRAHFYSKLKHTNEELEKALSDVKKLSGLLPICCSCKKIRDDKGYWNQIEEYIRNRSEAEFTHSICPKCSKELYPDFDHS